MKNYKDKSNLEKAEALYKVLQSELKPCQMFILDELLDAFTGAVADKIRNIDK